MIKQKQKNLKMTHSLKLTRFPDMKFLARHISQELGGKKQGSFAIQPRDSIEVVCELYILIS